MSTVISVKNLVKRYGKLSAVDGISFEVQKGEVFGLLGENGAGKTTTLEIIEGLRQLTKGTVKVLGHDVATEMSSVKSKIGVQLQSSAYYSYLTLKEILELFGSFYPKSLEAGKLLKSVNLEDKASSFVGALSGGQRQRFSIVASLVNDPQIVFLDEPTTGLDPLARRNLWELITQIKSQGKTIMLTTHYMEEAELLCDRVAIMDKGKIVALDKTHKLVERASKPFKISFISPKAEGIAPKLRKIGTLTELGGKSDHFELTLSTQANLHRALDLIRPLNPDSLTVSRASLEDVFIEKTGRNITEEG
ncbi:MAG: ABC transporter ATP-binding protein [Candidatus Berkelbacteria bacterium]|nr:ABC transporter ATP-binding protein [Candidatus Berkelbacteria bacterium]MCR4307031.1 ABC transporter ATP-binding protein [Candidatus Berkelbacteria bacterium]